MSRSISRKGKCVLVGAGPGDLGLVTLRGKELLEQADVVVYDALANPEMLGWARPDAEIIFAGKRAGEKTF
ncbi:MAG: uroporphyrinogen-III C-methyltransferase, partial [Verrucomicrobia bacterium]